MIADYSPILDMDGGGLMGYLLYPPKDGDVTPDDVAAFLNDGEVIEAFEGAGDFDATETYVRKVPATDEYGYPMMRYHYTDAPGRGARRCVRVEQHTTWGHWCVNHIYEPALVGIPVDRVLDPPWPKVLVQITPPEHRRRGGPHDGMALVYLCRPCHVAFEGREREARALALHVRGLTA